MTIGDRMKTPKPHEKSSTGADNIHKRLKHAYEKSLSKIRPEDLPESVRGDFVELMASLKNIESLTVPEAIEKVCEIIRITDTLSAASVKGSPKEPRKT